MRALVYRNSELTLEYDYPLPVPREGEALIRVLVTGICNTDLEIVQGYMDFQGVLGHEFVGFVEPLAANFEILEQVHLRTTDRVLILGDGKMGQLAAQVLALNGCSLEMIGHNAEKLALAELHSVHTYLVKDASHFAFENEQCVDVVVECSGSAQGFETALRLVRPRGTLILKSTIAAQSTLNFAPIVINEIRVQGSRCGPFAPALHALNQRLFTLEPLISARYTLNEGLKAFEYARQKGVLKVLMRI